MTEIVTSDQLLPGLPSVLREWLWETEADRVRLANDADGYTTSWYPLAQLDRCIDQALAFVQRDTEVVEAEAEVMSSFRYDDLGVEQRIVVQELTRQIRNELELMKQSGRKIGDHLIVIKQQLGHGQFGPWLRAEFGWSHDTANDWMRVAKLAAQNTNYSEFEDKFSRTALITLAKPSTPPAAIEEAGARAAAGEIITPAAAKEIVQAHKPAPLPADWDAWTARAKALPRGKIEVLNAERTGFYYSTAEGGRTGGWADICRAIEDDERAQAERKAAKVAAAPPAPDNQAIIARINELCRQRDTRAAYQEAHKLSVGLLHQTAFDAIDELVEGQPYRPIGQALPMVREVTIRGTTDTKKAAAVAVYGRLAVTPAQGDDPQKEIAPWKVTHIGSGYALGAAPTVQRACKAAAQLSAIGDWSFTKPEQMPEALKQAFKVEHAALVGAGLFVPRPEEARQQASPAAPAAPALAAPPAELSTTAYRAPYGTASSGRSVPIVPHVVVIEDRLAHFRLPVLRRLETVYDTHTQVRGRDPQGKEESHQQNAVYCLPDGAAWQRVQAAYTKLQQQINLLAEELRILGSYVSRLERAGGLKAAPNPLAPTVIEASADPDTDGDRMGWYIDTWGVPKITRKPVVRHSAKMLEHILGHGMQQQARCFVCPDDAAWAMIVAAHAEAEAARAELLALFDQLGSYDQALRDHRYRPTTPTPIEAALAVAAPVEVLDDDQGAALYAEVERRLSAIYAKLDDAEVALLDYLLADSTLWDHLTFTVRLAERTDRAGLVAALAAYEKEVV